MNEHLLHTLLVIEVRPVPLTQALYRFLFDLWDDVLSDIKAKPILDTPPPQYQVFGFCRFELHPCPIGELDQVLRNPSPPKCTVIQLYVGGPQVLIWL